MKLKLIMLPNPIVVSNEEIKSKDKYYSNYHQMILECHNDVHAKGLNLLNKNQFSTLTEKDYTFKVIAGIPELPSIDFSALSDEDCKRIGWINVERFAEDSTDRNYGGTKTSEFLRPYCINSYKHGFKTAQSLNDKKFTEEDMINAAKYGYEFRDTTSFPEHKFDDSCINNFKQNLEYLKSQPKVFDIEVEMEENKLGYLTINPNTWDEHKVMQTGKIQPKITNNSIKITKIL